LNEGMNETLLGVNGGVNGKFGPKKGIEGKVGLVTAVNHRNPD